MEFYAILDQVLDLLRRRGRVTYLGLKLEFGLDDALLEGVKQEMLFTGTARDEQGQGLVWTGETLPAPAQTIMAAHSTSLTPMESAHRTPDAERRQLTVMFCDLADSTRLAQQLDPEDLREVIRAYQATAAAVIQQFDGTIAQYLGDGVLVYFGWPMAHEDDAPRAVHAGLGIVDAITNRLNLRLLQEKGVQIAVRIGLHTGPVVVGAMGGGGRQEQLATGDTVNIASRLEGLAAPNTVVISQMTARLVEEAFSLEDLGLQVLKGVAEPMQVLRVLAPMDHTEDEGHGAVGMPFLVGRDEELGLLRRRWEQSKAGLGQVVLISGEAGIGKSTLVETLRRQVRQEGLRRIAYRCSPYHTNSALYPVIAHVQRVCNLQPDDSPHIRLDKLERTLQAYRFPLQEAVPLLASLLSIPLAERYAALSLSPQQQRQQTQDTLLAWLLQEAERQPVLTVWEDLHWADPSTLELLGLLVDQAPTVAMLHVLTFRPAFTPAWPARSHLTPITLNRLERPQVEALIAHLAGGKALPAEVVEHIVGKTDGVPLFVEELTKMLLESTLMRQDGDRYTLTGPLSAVAIPVTLQDSLMARLDQLPRAKEVAQLGAVLGREFAYDMLHSLSPLDESTLQESLTQLVKAELLYQRGRPPRAHYFFKHALIQDAAYASLLRSTRQQVHQQVAQLLERQFPEMVETQPELLAHHYTEAGQHEAAIGYWQRAGQHALQHSAYVEAIAHLRQGLAVLTLLPETPERRQRELDLQVALGPALIATKGYAAPDVERTYARAQELCQRLGDTPQLFPVLRGLMLYYQNRRDLQTTSQLGKQLLRLAQAHPDPEHLLLAHLYAGASLVLAGRASFGPDTPYPGSRALRPAGASDSGGALRPGPRCGVSQLADLGAVAAGCSRPGPAAQPGGTHPGCRRRRTLIAWFWL